MLIKYNVPNSVKHGPCLLLLIAMFCGIPSPVIAVSPEVAGIDYDIIYVRYPRRGDDNSVELPDAENPYSIEPGADLMLLHPNGSEEILVDCRIEGQESLVGGQANCSIQDPVISLDGHWVYYSKYMNMGIIPANKLTSAWHTLSTHSLLFKIQLNIPANERQEIQLTNGDNGFAVNKLAGNTVTDNVRHFGIRDLGLAPLPDGRLLFTSNRDAIVSFRQGTKGSLDNVAGSTVSQMYVMDDHDGSTPNKNLHLVGHSNLHHIQHPTVLKDGRILFTNWDDAGLRAEYATATLYTDHPDGGHLEQFLEPHHAGKHVEHFVTEISSGNVVVSNYYPRMASWGFGTLFRMPATAEAPAFTAALNTELDDDRRFFSRKGMDELTEHSTGQHSPELTGRYSTPSATPNDGMLVSFSTGPAVHNPPCGGCIDTPTLDAGIYWIANAGTVTITDPTTQIIQLKNDPDYNEMWPRAVTSYQRIHGVSAPSLTMPSSEYAPTQRNRGLVVGSPVGITGTSSMQNRESAPLGNDRFNNEHGKDGGRDTGWLVQGTDAGLVRNSDLWGVRILVMTADRYHAPWNTSALEKSEKLVRDNRSSVHVKGYYTLMSENWKILGEFPVRNPTGMADPDGEEDTSWLAKIPANTPHLIQSIDRYGMTLSSEQTWRHVRPGETFASCGGCHAHSKEGVEFTDKWADKANYEPWDLVNKTPMLARDDNDVTQMINRTTTGLWGVEFRRDILPILKNKCASCHTSANNAPPADDARLALFDSALSGFESDVRSYRALARDNTGEFTHGTTIPAGKTKYYTPQESRYVRTLQARASYLSWVIYDARLDGRTNDDLPGGLPIYNEDLDYVSGNCEASALLSNDEKGLISRWIDLGAPINLDRPRMRYTDDSLVPTMTLMIQPDSNGKTQLRIGVVDIESGVDPDQSWVEITQEGELLSRVNFNQINFNPSSKVGLYPLNIESGRVSLTTPLEISAVAQDVAGNKQTISRTMTALDPGTAGSVGFVAPSEMVNESVGTVMLLVNRFGGTRGAVSVRYAVTGGTSESDDYSLSAGSLNWADGEGGAKSIVLRVEDDRRVESRETVVLGLSAAVGGVVIGAEQEMVVIIRDNDVSPSADSPSDGGSGGRISPWFILLLLSYFIVHFRRQALKRGAY